jgi:predicted ATP-dependent endonuclease of OLD family
MSVRINTLEVENVKRVKAIALEPTANGLTVIGGRNAQGKTSVLDAICWALGGDRYRPSNPTREGSTVPPRIKLTLSNGLTVERAGKNSALKVTDPTGRKSGQQLLNEFTSELALNLPKFMDANNRDKAETLLQIIGVGPELHRLEAEISTLYNQRLLHGREADSKKHYAEEMPFYPNVPKEPVSISELIQQQQEILARNGENQRKRQLRDQYAAAMQRQSQIVKDFELKMKEARDKLLEIANDYQKANADALDLKDESTEELERSIAQFEQINTQVRANLDREKAMDEATALWDTYNHMSVQIDELRKAKVDLLKGANLPLPELGVEDGELVYRGQKWDCMSASEQLRVATAIVRALKPDCGFVLIDKLEQMDLDTLRDFGAWLEREGLQGIATRVSTGEECSILIEDGYAKDAPQSAAAPAPSKQWKAGEF